MLECIVCGQKTRSRVTLVGSFEWVPLCGVRCRRLWLENPLGYVGADAEACLAPWERHP